MTKLTLLTLLALTFCAQVFGAKSQMFYLGRSYTIITPKEVKRDLPLLVLIHGCQQNPNIITEGSEIESYAEKKKFIVLSPEQPFFAHASNCWNWYYDIQQRRLIGNEMNQIVSAIDYLSEKLQINKSKIFVAGLSSGGAMAHNLTACYPEVFAGSAIHSAPGYKTAETTSEAMDVLSRTKQKSPEYLGKKMYECSRFVSNKRLQKVLIIQGQDDRTVHSFHANLISDMQEVWRDFEDDGKRNHSVNKVSSKKSKVYPRNYVVTQIDKKYPGLHERSLLIEGLDHAWAGGQPLPYFDPEAPSATEFILSFFGL